MKHPLLLLINHLFRDGIWLRPEEMKARNKGFVLYDSVDYRVEIGKNKTGTESQPEFRLQLRL